MRAVWCTQAAAAATCLLLVLAISQLGPVDGKGGGGGGSSGGGKSGKELGSHCGARAATVHLVFDRTKVVVLHVVHELQPAEERHLAGGRHGPNVVGRR